MYEKQFGLNHKPFAITPDPRYLYLSDRHREALAHLLYGVGQGGGFVQLTGEVGTGKTTLCRSLLEQLPAEVDLALILNPRLDAVELVAAICDELGALYPASSTSLKVLVGALNDHLLQSHAAGRRTVLVIDEAQNLSPEVLEQVRLLTNLETAETKLLEIILIGQPELRRILARPELRQLAQRITARYHLEPLNGAETVAYVRHRLRVAGVSRPLFTPAALKAVVRLSGGVPRLINIICDRALLGAYVEEKSEVDARIVRRAAREVREESGLSRAWRQFSWRRLLAALPRRRLLPAALALLLLIALVPAFRALPWPEKIPAQRTAPNSAGREEAVLPGSAASAIKSSAAIAEDTNPGADDASPAQLADLLATLADSGETAAWQNLFRLWGQEELAPGPPPCAQAPSRGLQCLTETGNWTMLRRLDRPALLTLRTPEGHNRIALLTTLDREEAVLLLAGREQRLPLREIERYWYGSYQMLWRPPLADKLLREGDRGPEVIRLRTLLNRIDRPAADAAAHPGPITFPPGDDARDALFDAELTARVIAFQQAHGLQADGIVGHQTLLTFSRILADPATPRLRPEAPGDPEGPEAPETPEAKEK